MSVCLQTVRAKTFWPVCRLSALNSLPVHARNQSRISTRENQHPCQSSVCWSVPVGGRSEYKQTGASTLREAELVTTPGLTPRLLACRCRHQRRWRLRDRPRDPARRGRQKRAERRCHSGGEQCFQRGGTAQVGTRSVLHQLGLCTRSGLSLRRFPKSISSPTDLFRGRQPWSPA